MDSHNTNGNIQSNLQQRRNRLTKKPPTHHHGHSYSLTADGRFDASLQSKRSSTSLRRAPSAPHRTPTITTPTTPTNTPTTTFITTTATSANFPNTTATAAAAAATNVGINNASISSASPCHPPPPPPIPYSSYSFSYNNNNHKNNSNTDYYTTSTPAATSSSVLSPNQFCPSTFSSSNKLASTSPPLSNSKKKNNAFPATADGAGIDYRAGTGTSPGPGTGTGTGTGLGIGIGIGHSTSRDQRLSSDFHLRQPLSSQTPEEFIGAPFDGNFILNHFEATKSPTYQHPTQARPAPAPPSNLNPDPRLMTPSLRQSTSFSAFDGSMSEKSHGARVNDAQVTSPKRYSDEGKELKGPGVLRKKSGFSGLMSTLVGSPKKPVISAPENPVHVTHVGYDSSTGQFTVCFTPT